VDIAVHFHRETKARAVEVDNEAADNVLATKAPTTDCPTS
jgi:hypothetical protein